MIKILFFFILILYDLNKKTKSKPNTTSYYFYSHLLGVFRPIINGLINNYHNKTIQRVLWGLSGQSNSYTVYSGFKKVLFSFLKSRVVWFKKDLCSESKNRSSEKKNALCRWICNLRSFLNRKSTLYQILTFCYHSISKYNKVSSELIHF